MNLPHVTVALLVHFKGETKVDHHLIAIASVTQSGIEPRSTHAWARIGGSFRSLRSRMVRATSGARMEED